MLFLYCSWGRLYHVPWALLVPLAIHLGQSFLLRQAQPPSAPFKWVSGVITIISDIPFCLVASFAHFGRFEVPSLGISVGASLSGTSLVEELVQSHVRPGRDT